MSLNLKAAALTPSTVYTGGQFIISIEVYDDAFEFDQYHTEYNEHQGFADINHTMGGKMQ